MSARPRELIRPSDAAMRSVFERAFGSLGLEYADAARRVGHVAAADCVVPILDDAIGALRLLGRPEARPGAHDPARHLTNGEAAAILGVSHQRIADLVKQRLIETEQVIGRKRPVLLRSSVGARAARGREG